MNKLILLFFSVFLLPACKSKTAKKDTPATHSSEGYSNEDNSGNDQKTAFNIEAPAGWAKVDTVVMGSHLTLLRSPQEKNDNFLENVNVVTEKTGNMGLDEYFEKNLTSMNSGLSGFKESARSDRSINGLEFKNLKYTHSYSGTPIDVDVYFTVHKGNGYVITCSTLEGNLSTWQPVFDKIINSFSFN